MDEYTSEIFMGGRNTIVLHNTCEDSLLAAPIILDLVLLAELVSRIQLAKGDEPLHSFHPVAVLLSYLTKAPLVSSFIFYPLLFLGFLFHLLCPWGIGFFLGCGFFNRAAAQLPPGRGAPRLPHLPGQQSVLFSLFALFPSFPLDFCPHVPLM